MCFTSAAKTASLPGTKHSGETTKYMSPLQVFLQEKRKAVDNQRRRVSQLRANSRGAGETHRHFAGSFTLFLSVLTCTAWTGVAVACTVTDSLYKSSELSTGRKHLQASIRSCSKDIFPSSGLWQRREKHEIGCPLLTAKMVSRDQCFASRSVGKMLSHDQRLKPTVPEASRKKTLVHGRLRWIVKNWTTKGLPWSQRLSFILYWQTLRRESLLKFFFIATKRFDQRFAP